MPDLAANMATRRLDWALPAPACGGPIAFTFRIPEKALRRNTAIILPKFFLSSSYLLRQSGLGDVPQEVSGEAGAAPAEQRKCAVGTLEP